MFHCEVQLLNKILAQKKIDAFALRNKYNFNYFF